MLPRKMFENLRTAMAILVLFEQFWTSSSDRPTGMIHFVRTFSIHAWLKRKNYCYSRGSKLWKNPAFIKHLVENGWWGGCIRPPPLALHCCLHV